MVVSPDLKSQNHDYTLPQTICKATTEVAFPVCTYSSSKTNINYNMNQFLPFLIITLFSFVLLIVGNLSTQTKILARPATFELDNKSATGGRSMTSIIDGEGKTGLVASGANPAATGNKLSTLFLFLSIGMHHLQ